jgi:hypothetical protein
MEPAQVMRKLSQITEAMRSEPPAPRFWNSTFSPIATAVALLTAAIVGAVESVPAGLSLGAWLLALAAAVSLILWGRNFERHQARFGKPSAARDWRRVTGVATVAVLVLLLPIVITVIFGIG